MRFGFDRHIHRSLLELLIAPVRLLGQGYRRDYLLLIDMPDAHRSNQPQPRRRSPPRRVSISSCVRRCFRIVSNALLRATYSHVTTLGCVPGHVGRVLSQHQGHGLTVGDDVLTAPPKPDAPLQLQAMASVRYLGAITRPRRVVYLVCHLRQDLDCFLRLP